MDEMPSLPACGTEWSAGAMEAEVPEVQDPWRAGVWATAPKDMMGLFFAVLDFCLCLCGGRFLEKRETGERALGFTRDRLWEWIFVFLPTKISTRSTSDTYVIMMKFIKILLLNNTFGV
jgi:hypothetical protein